MPLHMSSPLLSNPPPEVPPTGALLPEAGGDSLWRSASDISADMANLKTIMTNEEIAKILPHRYPFLLIDRVVQLEPGKRAVGLKCVSANEPHFTGHFPDRPIMPGVLMIEAMAQLGGLICLQPPVTENSAGKVFYFTGVNGVRWKLPVTPGDVLVMEMTLNKFEPRIGFAKLTGSGYVNGKVSTVYS